MKPGPRRTPTKILQMRGSWLAQKRKKSDPSYGGTSVGNEVVIRMPSWLSDDAKAVWRLVVEHLKPMGILGKMDTNALGRYCVIFTEWRRAAQFVERHGQTISTKGPKDRLFIRLLPQVRLMIALGEQLLRLEHEFGMTPSARASFGLEFEGKGKQTGEAGKILGKGRFFAD
jgi:P27 family predicted phage terminase small subunit